MRRVPASPLVTVRQRVYGTSRAARGVLAAYVTAASPFAPPAGERAASARRARDAARAAVEVTRQGHLAPADPVTRAAIDSGRMAIIPVPDI